MIKEPLLALSPPIKDPPPSLMIILMDCMMLEKYIERYEIIVKIKNKESINRLNGMVYVLIL